MSICHLCRKDKKLINAHIVPKWAFKYLYPTELDQDQRPLILVGKNKRILKRPIGPYDPEILCQECDSFLGRYDGYGKNILLDSPFEIKGLEAYLIRNVDFEKLRIFILSVLWRAAISTHEEFARVSIGPYENKIREILIDCKNKITNQDIFNYSFIVGRFEEGKLPENIVNKNVQVPHTRKIDGINVGILYLPRGLKIFVKVDKRNFTKYMKLLADYQQEGLIIAKLGNYSESDEFKALIDVFKSQSTKS